MARLGNRIKLKFVYLAATLLGSGCEPGTINHSTTHSTHDCTGLTEPRRRFVVTLLIFFCLKRTCFQPISRKTVAFLAINYKHK